MQKNHPTTDLPPANEKPPAYPRPSRSIEDLIDEQGVRETATFENLFGIGRDLWADDAEFEEFLRFLQTSRGEKG